MAITWQGINTLKYIDIHFESSLNHFLFLCFVFRDIYFIRLI